MADCADTSHSLISFESCLTKGLTLLFTKQKAKKIKLFKLLLYCRRRRRGVDGKRRNAKSEKPDLITKSIIQPCGATFTLDSRVCRR